MFNIEENFPKYLAYKISDQEFYNHMKNKNSDTPFSSMTMADVFIYAMSLGFNSKRKIPIHNNEKSLTLPASAFDSQKRWLMRTIAVLDSNELEIILDNSKVVQIAESYANTGIDMLKDLDNESIRAEDIWIYEEHLRDCYEKYYPNKGVDV